MKNLETDANLTEYEIQVLIIIMSERHKSKVHRSTIDTDMSKANFRPLATSIAIEDLLQKQMVNSSIYNDEFNHKYEVLDLTAKGLTWIMANQKNLPLKFDDNTDCNSPF